jgi:hypothetical protein
MSQLQVNYKKKKRSRKEIEETKLRMFGTSALPVGVAIPVGAIVIWFLSMFSITNGHGNDK